MKLFIYKSLIIFFLVFLLFKLTFGSLIRNYEKKIDAYFSKGNVNQIREKIKEEMQKCNRKRKLFKS